MRVRPGGHKSGKATQMGSHVKHGMLHINQRAPALTWYHEKPGTHAVSSMSDLTTKEVLPRDTSLSDIATVTSPWDFSSTFCTPQFATTQSSYTSTNSSSAIQSIYQSEFDVISNPLGITVGGVGLGFKRPYEASIFPPSEPRMIFHDNWFSLDHKTTPDGVLEVLFVHFGWLRHTQSLQTDHLPAEHLLRRSRVSRGVSIFAGRQSQQGVCYSRSGGSRVRSWRGL